MPKILTEHIINLSCAYVTHRAELSGESRRIDDARLGWLYEVIVRRDDHQAAERRIAALEKDVAEIRVRPAA